MALQQKHKKIRDSKLDDIKQKIADKESVLERMKAGHAQQIAQAQEEIDELTVLKDALTALK